MRGFWGLLWPWDAWDVQRAGKRDYYSAPLYTPGCVGARENTPSREFRHPRQPGPMAKPVLATGPTVGMCGRIASKNGPLAGADAWPGELSSGTSRPTGWDARVASRPRSRYVCFWGDPPLLEMHPPGRRGTPPHTRDFNGLTIHHMSPMLTPVSRRKVSTTVYLEESQLEELRPLSARLRVPMAELIRGSIEVLLAAHRPHAGAPRSSLEAGVTGGGTHGLG